MQSDFATGLLIWSGARAQTRNAAMGWKNVKDAYKIKHIVHVSEQGVCIGSSYVSDIIVIALDGTIRKRYGSDGLGAGNIDLARYQAEFDADPDRLARLLAEPDRFGDSVPVFTYEGASIVEKRCEAPGWPNVTHDGALMYDNTFAVDKAKVVEWAKRNAQAGIDGYSRMLEQAQAEVQKFADRVEACRSDLNQLLLEYPL